MFCVVSGEITHLKNDAAVACVWDIYIVAEGLFLITVVFPPLSCLFFLAFIGRLLYARHALNSLHLLTLNLFNSYKAPVRSREPKPFYQDHKARKWWSQDSNSSILTQELPL